MNSQATLGLVVQENYLTDLAQAELLGVSQTPGIGVEESDWTNLYRSPPYPGYPPEVDTQSM